MADPNLTESAWQRAKVDAAGVYRTTTFQLGGALVSAIFSAVALILQEGQPTSTQVAVVVLAAAVAILLSVVVAHDATVDRPCARAGSGRELVS